MQINILGFAIPLFMGFILLEYLVAKKKGYDVYNLHNSIANISIGIAERLMDVLVAGMFYFVYDYIQTNYGLFHIKPGVFIWILLFLLTDFVWYWYHRLAHEVNILWMAHVVHHQSEDFNYTVSARITVFQAFIRSGFWAVLPFFGFPASMITSMLILHGLYPFFIHTRVIGKLGLLEYLLVTPSHHRVHHASNEKYLDKNYGDVLIIWDKLFGTFAKEEEEPVYGLTKPLNTYSFLWQHFHFLIELLITVRSKRSFSEKVRIVFGRPDKLDPAVRNTAEQLFSIKQTSGAIHRPLNRYVVWQMIILLVLLTNFILFEHYFGWTFKLGFTTMVILTLINCGAIMEQKRWVFQVESMRIWLVLLVPFYFPQYPLLKLSMFIVIIIAFFIGYRHAERGYLRYVYRRRIS